MLTLLLMAQLTLPASVLPPPGDYRCYENTPSKICILRYEDMVAAVIQRQLLETEVEVAQETINALRVKNTNLQATQTVECAVLKVTEPSKQLKAIGK